MPEELLFLAHRVPYPPKKGDKIRSFHLLRHLAKSYKVHGGGSPQGTVLREKLTHQDIAGMTGLTRETVTRILKKWQNSGKITVLEKRFIRLNSDF